MVKKQWIFLFIMALMWSSCRKRTDKHQGIHSATRHSITFSDEQMKIFRIGTLREEDIFDSYSAVGEIKFDESRVVRVFPVVSGQVHSVHVSLGDYVNKGDILADLLSTDMTSYQRNYNVAKSNFEVAEKNLIRAKTLFEIGMLSEKEYAEAKRDFNTSSFDYNEKSQILNLYGGSQKNQDAIYQVFAPNSGFIVERNVNEGTQIRTDNNTALFVISDLQTVWVWINVHESDLAHVKMDDAIEIKTISYPDIIFNGHIDKIKSMLDDNSRVIQVRTILKNKNMLLKPNMFVTANIISQKVKRKLTIPKKAVTLEKNKYYVMRHIEGNTFEKIQITIDASLDNSYGILSGLQAGDQVIIDSALLAMEAYNLQE